MIEGDVYLKEWVDHPRNPLIDPPWPEYLLGDPTVVLPQESPDGEWHLFANTLLGIHHYLSTDGIDWYRLGKICPGFRAYIYSEGGIFYMLYEEFTVLQFRSRVSVRSSENLYDWSEQAVLLEPAYEWEGHVSRNTGNPCLLRIGERYRLYYSAGVVFLPDLGFCEPKYIGVAHSDSITGPYRKHPVPLIWPDPDDPYRNLGAGAMKVIFDSERGRYYGFNNPIYSDDDGRTRSAIMLLSSPDGLDWEYAHPNPIIAPEGSGWKKALVYQLDVRRVDNEMWLYYNSRSGWRFGKERIGLATCRL